MPPHFSTKRAHRLLIQAAVDSGERGAASFRAWRESVRLTDVDYPSQKMLSAVGHHLGHDEVSQQVLKVARFTWLRSQLLLQAGLRAAAALQAEGIPTAWIKGGAVLAWTSTEISKRPMDDVDLLVPLEEVTEATECLNRAGFFSLADRELLECPGLITRNVHAIAFRDSQGAEVDLHWQLLKGDRDEVSEHALWSRSKTATLLGQEIVAISVEDLLVQVIATNREGSDAYWVVDALRLIEDNKVDFAEVLTIARERRLGRMSSIALAIISSFRPGVIPARHRAPAIISRFVDRLHSAVFGNIVMRNVSELVTLGVPRSLHTDRVYLQTAQGELCPLNQTPADNDGHVVFSFSHEEHQWFRNPAAVAHWHQAEETGTWSSAPKAHVKLPLPQHYSTVVVTASYRVISSEFSRVRSTAVYADGKLVRRALLRDPHGLLQEEKFVVTRPPDSRPLVLSFFVNSVVVPRDHGMSLDPRPLGIFLHQIVVSQP